MWAVLLAVSACGGSGGSDPGVPTTITLNDEDVSLAATGVAFQLTAAVEDEDGDPLPDAAVTWESSDGNIVLVSATGVLVAQGPGTAEVTATSGEATATAAVTVNSISALLLHEGNGQTAEPGTAVEVPPAVRVINGTGDPVANVQVRFQVGNASGTLTGDVQLTGADGVARVGSWRLGSEGVNTLNAAVDGADVEGEPAQFIATTAAEGAYDIAIRYLGDFTNAQLLAFAEAELRWESLITGDLVDVAATLPANSCGENPEDPGPFDDLVIFATIEPIDGPFGILGQAGPCFVRVSPAPELTVIGRMIFDTDDMDLLETEGLLNPTILHEMGHVLGFGTLWPDLNLLVDPADPDPAEEDPHFTGATAIAAFNAAGGTPYTGEKVPVMNVGGAGTINSHWRDEVLDPEIMTGFIATGANPLSSITVSALQDMGYTVNVSGADAFTFDPSLRIAKVRRGRQLVNDIISDPIRRMDVNGRIVGVIKR